MDGWIELRDQHCDDLFLRQYFDLGTGVFWDGAVRSRVCSGWLTLPCPAVQAAGTALAEGHARPL